MIANRYSAMSQKRDYDYIYCVRTGQWTFLVDERLRILSLPLEAGVDMESCAVWTRSAGRVDIESFGYGTVGRTGRFDTSSPKSWSLMISRVVFYISLVIFGSKKFHNWGFGRPNLSDYTFSLKPDRSLVSWSGNSHLHFTPNRYPNSTARFAVQNSCPQAVFMHV